MTFSSPFFPCFLFPVSCFLFPFLFFLFLFFSFVFFPFSEGCVGSIYRVVFAIAYRALFIYCGGCA